MIAGKQDAADNYSRGYYTIGKQLLDKIGIRLGHQIEKMDFLQAIMVNHSINGGTGSGLETLMAQKLSFSYPKTDKINLLVYPSEKFSNSVVEPYNAILFLYSLIQLSSLAIPVTNERMYEIMETQFDIYPSFSNINYLIAQTVSNLTAGNRFQGEHPWSIKDLINNLVPFPRIHFALNSFNKFSARSYSKYQKQNIQTLTKEVFDFKNCCVDVGVFNPRYLTTFLMYRTPQLVYNSIVRVVNKVKQQESSIKFADWFPTNTKIGICNEPAYQLKSSGFEFADWFPTNTKIGICNEPAYQLKSSGFESVPLCCNMISINFQIDQIFSRLNYRFDRMYTKRAFVHWYIAQGLEQQLFSEARQDLAGLEKDYEQRGDFQEYYGQPQ